MATNTDDVVGQGSETSAGTQRTAGGLGHRWQGLSAAFQGEQRKATIILLLSPVLVVTWKYCGSRDAILAVIPPEWFLWNNAYATAAVINFLLAFVLLGAVPALVVKLVFHERLADYGVQLGDRVRTFRSMAICGPIFVFSGYVGSRAPAMHSEYPANPLAATSATIFAVHALTYLLFYLAWEFHFRGFLQFGLRESMGDVNAVLVVVLASVLAHLGKPGSETYGAIFGGLLWGMFAFRTRSIVSGLVQHALLGLSVDWFICFG
jgi:membrane protease YdiL (CAAX protease family)